MKKFISSTVILLIQLSTSGQGLHHYNPTPLASVQDQGTTSLFVGVNKGRALGQVSVNLMQNLVITGSLSGHSKVIPSEFSPAGNSVQDQLRILDLRLSYIKKLSDSKIGLEAQLGAGSTHFSYSDLPSSEQNVVHEYKELVNYSETSLHSAIIVHAYSGKSDIYFGLKQVYARYNNLFISHSSFDETISKNNETSLGRGALLGYTYRHKQFSLGAQIGFVGGENIKFEEIKHLDFGIFGNTTYTSSKVYTGLELTSMITVGYSIF